MIKRESYMRQIRPFIGNEPVKVLTGLRRSGKSVMLELIREELSETGIPSSRIIFVNFEKMSNRRFCTAEALHAEILRRAEGADGKVYLFFDEIQEVQNWEVCINSLRLDLDCDIYITGSNARLLSGELATCLAGRYVEFVIYPFSFREFLDMRRQLGFPEDRAAAFRDYIRMGGMPFLVNLASDAEACEQYLRDVCNSAVLKDVIQRSSVRDAELLERIAVYVIANIGHPFSANSLSRFLKNEGRKIAPETILNYIRYCMEAFLFYRVSREDLAGKKILSVNEKYYIADHGFREAVYGSNGRDMDQVLENMICIEALRRGYTVTAGKTGNAEIDFVLKKGSGRVYVQVAYLLASPETVDREFGAYAGIPDNYPKYVVSTDEYDMSRNGYIHKNIRDFLLTEKWE